MYVSAAVGSYDICVRTCYVCVLYILSGATRYVCGATGSGSYYTCVRSYDICGPALARAGNYNLYATN
jgi:hypothetical protein